MNTATFVTEVTVVDPVSGNDVQVAIYRDDSSTGMFGIDSSYLLEALDENEPVPSVFDIGEVIYLQE